MAVVYTGNREKKKERKEMKSRGFFVFELILQAIHDIPNIWLIYVLGSVS